MNHLTCLQVLMGGRTHLFVDVRFEAVGDEVLGDLCLFVVHTIEQGGAVARDVPKGLQARHQTLDGLKVPVLQWETQK